jgi:hypothetical protein
MASAQPAWSIVESKSAADDSPQVSAALVAALQAYSGHRNIHFGRDFDDEPDFSAVPRMALSRSFRGITTSRTSDGKILSSMINLVALLSRGLRDCAIISARSLCPLYGMADCSISNLYARRSTFMSGLLHITEPQTDGSPRQARLCVSRLLRGRVSALRHLDLATEAGEQIRGSSHMERGFWITVSNSAGILDSAFARTEEETRELAIELLSGFPHLDDGDTLRVEAGEVCRPGRCPAA